MQIQMSSSVDDEIGAEDLLLYVVWLIVPAGLAGGLLWTMDKCWQVTWSGLGILSLTAVIVALVPLRYIWMLYGESRLHTFLFKTPSFVLQIVLAGAFFLLVGYFFPYIPPWVFIPLGVLAIFTGLVQTVFFRRYYWTALEIYG